jgi:hypothetical protein
MHLVQRIVLRRARPNAKNSQRQNAHTRQPWSAESSVRRFDPIEEWFHALVPGLVPWNDGEFSTLGLRPAYLAHIVAFF